MSRRQLTSKQQAFLQYLVRHIRLYGMWPTYREIVDEFDYRSPNSVTQNLQALHKKGYLQKTPDGYDLVDQPQTHQTRSGIPIRGIITAGVLQEAVEADLGTITLETLFPNLDRMYAIRVAGRSMIGAGIQDGDYVLLVDDDIPNGGIGAVLYNGETSLKYIYQDANGVRLDPANDDYPSIRIAPQLFEEVRILGKYIGHVNKDGIYKRTANGRAA